jgi:septation ring formation regulator EzrA
MNQAVKPLAFQAMTTDLQVSMDDVVSAFVSQYENNLFDRKKELGKDIRALEKDLEQLEEDIKKRVTGDEFAAYSLPFGLTIKVERSSIDYTNKIVKFNIEIKERNSSRWSNSITINKTKPIPKPIVKRHDKIQDELKDLRADLSEVLVALKSVTRKERQVRGKIAIRKLEDSGYASLMADPELIALVQLDDE